jgi:hypothetical protein
MTEFQMDAVVAEMTEMMTKICMDKIKKGEHVKEVLCFGWDVVPGQQGIMPRRAFIRRARNHTVVL